MSPNFERPEGTTRTIRIVGRGLPGKSAYEIALDHGFVGTEAEWLASLGGTAHGVPPGGLSGQVLAKSSDADFSAAWIDPPTGSAAPSQWLVILDEGQSNRAGMGGPASVDPVIDWMDDRIFQFSPDGGAVLVNGTPTAQPGYARQLVKASAVLRSPHGETWIGGLGPSPAMAFARAMVPYLPAGTNIVIIPCSVPGSGLVNSSWKAPDGELFLQAVSAATAFMTLYPDAELAYILTNQGENEAASSTVTPAEFEAAWYAKYAAYRTLIPNAASAAIIVGSMVPEWVEAGAGASPPALHGAEIDLIHRLTPQRLDRAVYVAGPRNRFKPGDTIHYNADGGRELGRRMAEKARSTALTSNGSMSAPTSLQALGTTISWQVPTSDAPGFAIEHRPAGSTDAWSRIVVAPRDYYRPGDTLTYPLQGLSEANEVRVAGLMRDTSGPFSPSIVVTPAQLPTPWSDLDFAAATITGGRVVSVPSTGTDPTPWAAPANKQPLPGSVNGHAALQTSVGNSLLIGPTLPLGSYTLFALVRHIDLAGGGTYFSTVEFFTRYLVWRGASVPTHVYASMNGNGAIVDSGPVLAPDKWFAIAQVFDPAAAAGDELTLYVNGVTVGQGAAALWAPDTTGIVLNAIGGTTEGDGNQGGNNAVYGRVTVWTAALAADEIAAISADAAAVLGVTLGE
ncbi:sialate O-acetylesterase [Microvirga antarctica]|uniref:sialate O-acetylesterase n=1 Tax=Microvirga antarctica TaxID=2819233 RepID=UPI001B31315B|nr:sialate O-acetylesterase [Microvirga antarctica]